MGKKYLAAIFLAVVAFLSGCAVIGRGKDHRPFDEQGLAQLKPGQTTTLEVTKIFGAPTQVVKLSNGNAYLYNRSLSKATGLWLALVTFVNYDTQYDRLVFFFNQNDVLTHYGSSFKADTAAYGTPF
jgi:outer membrane protein assembly factor BamE (lipoprotein component of BamABCDE complex)